MKKYRVMVPIVAACYVEVEAENEKEAIACALNSEELSLENVEEWEGLEAIVTGNVVYTYNHTAWAEELENLTFGGHDGRRMGQ
ncbi:hypothetical protein [Clostridium sp. FS41]|uniref:hypothetical protein n=2 Tax=Clostridia TaxID=186801 RepID=UPI0005D2E49F|nr:hypothetical protein [Clostridium sp. FS41]KJJ73115.1 hypothetical protein CLFS41_18860 [Clostridium sp. FS41]